MSRKTARFKLSDGWKVFLNGEKFPTLTGGGIELVTIQSTDITCTAKEIQCTFQRGDSFTVDNRKGFSAVGVTSVIIRAGSISSA
jgi:hypothetical protein